MAPKVFHKTCRSLLVIWLVFSFSDAKAERLPLKPYTTADGLAHNVINRIVRDSRGFLWFCTQEGLSRFDGYSFTNYGTEQGLPHATVNDFLETRKGQLWIATNEGLVRFNPRGKATSHVVYERSSSTDLEPMFTTLVPEDESRRSRAANVLYESRDGTLWVGSFNGLFRLDLKDGRQWLTPIELNLPNAFPGEKFVNDIVEDRTGSLWIATPHGLYRRWPNGNTARYTAHEGLPDDHVQDLLIDHQHQLWVATRGNGFFRLAVDETQAPPVLKEHYSSGNGFAADWVFQLFETANQHFWVATNAGVVSFSPDAGNKEERFRTYTTRNGLSFHEVTALNEDSGGNLWLGTNAIGAMKLAHDGFITYDEQDRVLSVGGIFADARGGVCYRAFVQADPPVPLSHGEKQQYFRFGRYDGQRFTWFTPIGLEGREFGWVGQGTALQARTGEWWFGTAEGLYRFPAADDFTKTKPSRPLAVYHLKETPRYEQVYRIFEDSRGDIWTSTVGVPNGLGRWVRASETLLRDVQHSPGLPVDDLAQSFGEDRFGAVWIGFSTGVARYQNGGFNFFTTRDGLPAGAIRAIYSDRHGRLWFASARGGLIRVDEPSSELPTFISYTTANGLSSNITEVLTEDLQGRIYVSTGRGLDRLDPTTNRVKHFTTADGLASGDFLAAFCDQRGTLWFGTQKGLSRFTPQPDTSVTPPPILVTGLLVAGERHTVSALGETEIKLSDLAAAQNQLQIDFVALGFAPGEVLQYQYRFEGVDSDWSKPTSQRNVNFAGLVPGSYKFLVRAVNSEGGTSPVPAVITFTILRPVWLRWWFVSLAALVIAGVAYSLYRYRVSRLLEVADMRMRIATDLHDDIGANLTKIAILSEVVRQQLGANGAGRVDGPLSSIARISRESAASMSDIVWAINPRRDQLLDLVRRMREHAEEVFALRDVDLRFEAPEALHNLKLGVNVRRDLLLIFKETINNAARHSRCSQIRVNLGVEASQLSLVVSDDGEGFNTNADSRGQGLANLKLRTERLGGTLEVESRRGDGTRVTCVVPLRSAIASL